MRRTIADQIKKAEHKAIERAKVKAETEEAMSSELAALKFD
jgi:hypothetical protein